MGADMDRPIEARYVRVSRYSGSKCPKCGAVADRRLIAGHETIASAFRRSGTLTLWAREDAVALLPEEVLRISCSCGWQDLRLTLDSPKRFFGLWVTDDDVRLADVDD
jgi:hypothetical protein